MGVDHLSIFSPLVVPEKLRLASFRPADVLANEAQYGLLSEKQPSKNKAQESSEELSQVITGRRKDGVHAVAIFTRQVIRLQPVVRIEMSNRRLNRRTPVQPPAKGPRMTLLAFAREMDLDRRNRAGSTSLGPVTEGFFRIPGRQTAGLLNGLRWRVTVIGIAMKCIGPDDPCIFGAADDRYSATEFITLVHFVFGNAFHLRCMNTVNLVLIISLLTIETLGQLQLMRKLGIRIRAFLTNVSHDVR